MKQFLSLVIASVLLASPAYATVAQLTIKDGGGTSRQFDFFQDGSSNYFSATGLMDATGNPITSANPLPIGATALPLPTGAATSSLQTTGNTTLSTIATNTALTAAGTSATSAQGVQGVTGGVAMPTKTGVYSSAGAAQYNVSVTSVTSLTVPSGTTIAQICVDGAAAKYTDDGTTPTSTTGMDAPVGCFAYSGPLSAFKIIGTTSGVTINVSFYK